VDIVVIGAGAFGAWVALLFCRAGHRVTLIEREGPANERSSSAGESRIIRSAYGRDEIYTAMARRSLQAWKSFFREEDCPEYFRKTGVLWIANAADPWFWEARSVFERLSVPYDWLTGDAIRQRYPQFNFQGESVVALFEPEAGALLAERSVQRVVAAAVRAGVNYQTAEIYSPVLDVSGLQSIQASDGQRFTADHFVFACGSWLPKLFDLLHDAIRPTRQDLFFFAATDDAANEYRPDGFPIWIDQSELSIAYGFPDLGSGVKVGFHRLGPGFDPDMPRYPAGIDEISAARDYIGRRLPGLRNAKLNATHVCHYENTTNGDFLIDAHPNANNLWLVGGGSGHGFKHAPAVAEYLLSVVTGATNRRDRFSLAANGRASGRRVL
jgi:glycine/D-amino acid oxidase-like deaminating enzyme